MTCTENALVEQPAIKLFDDLVWNTRKCWEEIFDEESLLGRKNHVDVEI